MEAPIRPPTSSPASTPINRSASCFPPIGTPAPTVTTIPTSRAARTPSRAPTTEAAVWPCCWRSPASWVPTRSPSAWTSCCSMRKTRAWTTGATRCRGARAPSTGARIPMSRDTRPASGSISTWWAPPIPASPGKAIPATTPPTCWTRSGGWLRAWASACSSSTTWRVR